VDELPGCPGSIHPCLNKQFEIWEWSHIAAPFLRDTGQRIRPLRRRAGSCPKSAIALIVRQLAITFATRHDDGSKLFVGEGCLDQNG
jgi:hypothetical protein